MLSLKTDLNKVLSLTHPCRCRACENSCNYGSGALAKDDHAKMANLLKITENELKEKYLEEIERFNTKMFRPKILREEGMPYGKCIFFEQNIGCKVHEAKPLECKIAMGCKSYGEELITWFDLNHFLNPKDAESVRKYKLYLESGGKTLPGAEIESLVPKDELEKIMNYDDKVDKTDWDEVLGVKGWKKEAKEKAGKTKKTKVKK